MTDHDDHGRTHRNRSRSDELQAKRKHLFICSLVCSFICCATMIAWQRGEWPRALGEGRHPMRPAEFPVEAIIEAGNALQAAGRNVTGFALRQRVGGGNPTRLRQVWDEHLAKAQPVVELPVEVADALAHVTKSLTEQVSTLVTAMYARAQDVAERSVTEARHRAAAEVEEATIEVDRAESERDAARVEVEALMAKLAESQRQAQEQAIELAQLRERMSASVVELNHVRDDLSEARNQASAAREEAAHLRGRIEAIEGQRAELVKVLAERPAGAEKGADKADKPAGKGAK